MKREQECRFVRLLPDGTAVVRLGDAEHEIEMEGIRVPQPPSPIYVEIFTERIPLLVKPLRCLVNTELPNGRIRGKLMCFAWNDKSGDVWLDLATVLLDEGVVHVADGEFSDREDYLRHERGTRSGV